MAYNPTQREVDEMNGLTGVYVDEVDLDLDNFYNTPSRNNQVAGDHYSKYEVQVWDIILMYKLDYFEGNMLKYLLRSKGDRKEDLLKLKHYLDKKLEGTL